MTQSFSAEPDLVVADRFRLVAWIGEGSVGTVWRAADLATGEDVALKLVPFDGDTTREERFLREAKANLRLRSPHVVTVLDVGAFADPSGRVGYMALELLRGETLLRRLRRVRMLTPSETLHIFEQVGRAVSLAHGLGLVHRDLKPANIFLCEGGVAKVLDFGLAKSFGAPLSRERDVLTRVGDMIGTPLYMSPEQAKGSTMLDHRTDLWAIGAMVFECLCGERMFRAQTLDELVEQLQDGAIVVPSSVADVPAGFDLWFNRAVNRDVQARFQTASSLVLELAQVLAPEATRRGGVSFDMGAHTAVQVFPHAAGDQRTVRRFAEGRGYLEGRSTELAAIREAFAAHARVVTLCGARGVGRATLAYAHADGESASYTGGTWPCSFGGIADADAMWRRLAQALGTMSSDDEPAVVSARAVEMLGRAMLLLLRVERVRERIAPVVTELLRMCPQLCVIVTSDAPLGIANERVLHIRVPPAGHPLANRLSAGIAKEKLRLAAVLAVEDSDRSVKAVAEVALDQLDEDARSALRQLSCFRAPFTIESAERVVMGLSSAVATVVERLVERGWLVTKTRFEMHPLLRKVCSTRLAAQPKREVLALFDRHGALFARSGSDDDIAALTRRGGAGVWQRALADAEDIAAARDRASKRDMVEVAARCGRALGVVEHELGRSATAARLFLTAMSLTEAGSAFWVSLASHRVAALMEGGRLEAAATLARRVALDEPSPSGSAGAEALRTLAEVQLAEGDFEGAGRTAQQARQMCADIAAIADANVLIARAGMAGSAAPAVAALGSPHPAIELLESAANAYHTLGESRLEAATLTLLGRLDDALVIHRRLGARLATARVLLATGRDADRREAAALFRELGLDLPT